MLGSAAWRPHRSLLLGAIALVGAPRGPRDAAVPLARADRRGRRGEAAGRGALPRGAARPGLRPRGHAGLPLAAGGRGDGSRWGRYGLRGALLALVAVWPPSPGSCARCTSSTATGCAGSNRGQGRSSRPNGRPSCGPRGSVFARRAVPARRAPGDGRRWPWLLRRDRPRPAGDRRAGPGVRARDSRRWRAGLSVSLRRVHAHPTR